MSNSKTHILVGVFPAMVVPFLGSLFYFALYPGTLFGTILYTVSKSFLLFWPIVAVVLIERKRLPIRPIEWSRHFQAIPLGVLTGILIPAVMIVSFFYSPLGDYVKQHTDKIYSQIERIGVLNSFVPFGIVICFIHSLLEEYYWRWYIFGRLSKILSFAPAVIISSLSFAAHHYIILSQYFSVSGTLGFGTCVAVGGGLWCWLYQRQNSLVGIWISHLLVDAAIFIIGYIILF